MPIRILLFIIVAFLFSSLTAQVHIPAGPVSGTFESSQSPYYIDGDIVIPADSALFIEAGVQIWITGQFEILVEGSLLALGTINLNIIMEPTQGDWKGIAFKDTDLTAQDTSFLEYCWITDCNDFNGGALWFEYAGRAVISNCYLFSNQAVNGAGAWMRLSDVTFNNCEICNNTALDGAGVYVDESSPVFNDCGFCHNDADGAGGAGVLINSPAIILNGCLAEDNTSHGSGGAFYIKSVDQFIVSGSEFTRNESYTTHPLSTGGALGIKDNCNSVIEYCKFRDNKSGTEGGAVSAFSEIQIVSCLFTGNISDRGGAIDISGIDPDVTNRIVACTFTGNSASLGKEILVEYGNVLLVNSILWEDEPLSLIHLDTDFPLNSMMTVAYCDVFGGMSAVTILGPNFLTWGEGNINTEPMFVDSGNKDYHLDWNSPCIDAGDPDPAGYGLPPFDLEGNQRVMNGVVDMGCYEYQGPVNVYERNDIMVRHYTLFPVPCRGTLYITSVFEDFDLMLLDIYGRTVLGEMRLSGPGRKAIQLQDLRAGNYVVYIRSDQHTDSFILPVVGY